MSKLDNFFFYIGVSVLIFSIFLTFVIFQPKKIYENENLILIKNMTNSEIRERALNLMEPGDIILTKPKSLYDYYEYNKKMRHSKTRLNNFFFYNLFDKILISSLGDTYWHVAVYLGNGTMNSLYFSNRNEPLDEIFIQHKYFKVMDVKTSNENKILALKRAKNYYEKQDIYYSLKNGLIIVALESTNSDKKYPLKENELVCSSYVALLYKEINFDGKPFTHITPVDIELSEYTETKFLVNKTGFYVKDENR